MGLSEWAGPSGPILGEADLRWAIVGADLRCGTAVQCLRWWGGVDGVDGVAGVDGEEPK